jgi:hypothetical protein
VVKVRGHPRRGAERRSVTGNRWRRGELRRPEVGDESDIRGPLVREMRGRRPAQEGANRRGKRLLQNTLKACAGWPAERSCGLGDLGRGGLGRPAGQGRGSGQAG